MKETFKDFFEKNCRPWIGKNPGVQFDAELEAAMQDQIDWVKQNHPREFKNEVNGVLRAREWIASERLVARLRERQREAWEEEHQPAKGKNQAKDRPGLEPGD